MGYSLNLVSVGSFASATLTLLLAVVGATRWKARAAPYFSAMMLCLTLYSFGSGFEYMSPTVRVALSWTHVEYLGISFIPLTLLLFALSFAGSPLARSRPFVALLFVLSLTTLLMQETTELNRLFYVDPRQQLHGSIHSLIFPQWPLPTS